MQLGGERTRREPHRRRRVPVLAGLGCLLGLAAAGCGAGEGATAAAARGEGAEAEGTALAPPTGARRDRPDSVEAFGAELVAGMTAEGTVDGPVVPAPGPGWRAPVVFLAVQVGDSSRVDVLVSDTGLLCESGVPARPGDHIAPGGAVRVTRAGAVSEPGPVEPGPGAPDAITASLVLVDGC